LKRYRNYLKKEKRKERLIDKNYSVVSAFFFFGTNLTSFRLNSLKESMKN